MSIPVRQPQVTARENPSDLPEFKPRFPADVIARFPALKQYQDGVTAFHSTEKKVLVRLLEELNRAIDESEESASLLSTTVAALDARIASLESIPPPEVPDAPEATTELAESLLAHIESSTVHGIEGQVVGTTDAQELDSKTIGTQNPLMGVFMPLVVRQRIPGGLQFTIPSGSCMIAGGSVEVDGQLVVDGELAIV